LFLQQIPNVQKYKDIDTLDSDKITVTWKVTVLYIVGFHNSSAVRHEFPSCGTLVSSTSGTETVASSLSKWKLP
jgi:hypothetical protein